MALNLFSSVMFRFFVTSLVVVVGVRDCRIRDVGAHHGFDVHGSCGFVVGGGVGAGHDGLG